MHGDHISARIFLKISISATQFFFIWNKDQFLILIHECFLYSVNSLHHKPRKVWIWLVQMYRSIMFIWDVISLSKKVEFCKLESHSFGEDPKLIWFPFFFLHCQLQPEYLLLLLTFELLFCDLLLLIVISLFIFQNTATRQWPCRHPSYSCFPLFSLWCCNKHSPRTI